ncbi:MAG: hypothetical protein J1F40_01945 [Prevotellaceae bacterium]|nr:hypothetical protein [Prevotellaceae bacterium]
MAKDYFQTDEFNELLNFYERRKKKQKSIYLDADEFSDIADYYLNNDLPALAMEAADEGLAIHPNSDVLLTMKSAICIYQSHFEEAKSILDGMDEDDPEVLYQLAQLQYAYHFDIPKAEKMWQRWLQMENGIDGDDTEYKRENYIHIISTIAVLHEPQDVLEEGKWKEIVDTLRRWIREYIDTFQPLGKSDHDIQLVDICRENDQVDFMCEALTQVLEERPYLPKGWSTLALGHYLRQETEQALEACAFALAINPNDTDAMLTKAYTLYEMGDKQGAKAVFRECLAKGGDTVQILPHAEMLFSDGEREEALSQLTWISRYLEIKKKKLEKRRERAAKTSAEEFKNVDNEYNAFMAQYKKTMYDMGGIYYRNGCYKRSVRTYVSLTTCEGEKTSENFFLLGLSWLALNKIVPARASFSIALSNSNDRVKTGLDIAMTFIMNNYDELALSMLDYVDSVAEKQNSPYAEDIAAAKSLIYLKMGDTEQFLTFFKIACEDTPLLVHHVYGSYFPTDLPIDEWYDYAQREIQSLLKKITQEDVHIAGF